MGYNFKNIDKRRQDAPFWILEKNIYENLNVGTLARVTDVYTGGCKLVSIPSGKYFNSSYSLSSDTYSIGDLVLVMILDNYGTEELTDKTSVILHDYRNAVILGKVNKL